MAKKYEYRHREVYRDVSIDIKANSSKELIEKVNRKKAQIDKGIIDGSMKLSEYGKLFLKAHKLHTVSASWYKDMEYFLAVIVREIGDKPLTHIKPLHLQNYLNSLADKSDSTIKKQYDLICQIFRDAYRNGAVPADYSEMLTRPIGRTAINGRSITDRERAILLQVLDGHRGELFCKLILYCGLRPSEVQALQWCDIDFRKATVTVSKSMKRDGSIGSPKTPSAYRIVPIPEHLLPLLRQHRMDPFDYLFPHDLSWRRRMWKNVQREMNLAMGCKTYRNKLVPPFPLADDFTLYNLRHTYCTDLEKMGVPINIASRLMGHSSISITSKIYTHASVEALEIARKLINNEKVSRKVSH